MIFSQRAVMNSNVAHRVKNLTDSITFQVFQYTTRYTVILLELSYISVYIIRGLFECDKLIFTAQMAFQILLMKDEINPLELDFLLRWLNLGEKSCERKQLPGSPLLPTSQAQLTS